MKEERFNQIKKAAEVNAAFALATTGNVKKQVNYEAVIKRIESLTTESVTNQVLDYYRPIFGLLPRNIKGAAKKAFCDAIRDAMTYQDGFLFAVDDNGNVIPKRVLAKVTKKGNEDLFRLLSNLLTSPTATATATGETTDTGESVTIDDLDPVTAEAVAWMLEAA